MKWRDLQWRGSSARSTSVSASPWRAGRPRGATTAGSSSSTSATRAALAQLVINPERAPEAAKVAHGDPQRVRAPRRGRGRRARARGGQPEPADGRGRAAGGRARDHLALAAAALPARRGERRRDPPLRYRYLDLRRARMQRNMRTRGDGRRAIRALHGRAGFVDMWTPDDGEATPEGARDFLVPVRLQPGGFFALPQSPQIFKQTLVVAGFEPLLPDGHAASGTRISAPTGSSSSASSTSRWRSRRRRRSGTCSRARSSRRSRRWAATPPERPFRRLTWHEAMARFGSDKPDLRFGLEIAGPHRARPAAPSSGCSRRRRASGTSLCRSSSRAPSSPRWRSWRRSGAARGSRTSCSTRRARCARRSRSSSPAS